MKNKFVILLEAGQTLPEAEFDLYLADKREDDKNYFARPVFVHCPSGHSSLIC
jgi:hypothetical protein